MKPDLLPRGAKAHEVSEVARRLYEVGLDGATAFLPRRVPLNDLPGTLRRFVDACSELPNRYPRERGGVRSWLEREFGHDDAFVRRVIPQLSPPEADALLVALCVLGHTYRWDTVPPAAGRFEERQVRLPAGVAAPWTQLSRRMDLPRVGSAWSLHLNNWSMTDRPDGARYSVDELTPQKLRLAHTWLLGDHGVHLENFSIAFVLFEAQGCRVVRALVDAVVAAATRDVEATLEALRRAHAAIRATTRRFSKSIGRSTVDPATWLHIVQPTFAWAAEVDETGRVEDGPSGLQLGTIQALDAVLGIAGRSQVAQLARAARRHLPFKHRRFLSVLDLMGPILRRFVSATRCPELTQQFDACVLSVARFRQTHRALGGMYLRHRPPEGEPRVSTGLLIETESDPVTTFERSMTSRIRETRAATLGGGRERPATATH